MLVLFESAAGYSIFKVLKPGKLEDVDNLAENFVTVDKSKKMVNLIAFSAFKDSAEALKASLSINDGKIDKKLSKTLKKAMKKETTDKLMVLDAKLGNSIKDKFADLDIVSNSSVIELVRNIRSQMSGLIPDVSDKEHAAMRLGLGHNVSRYKLKFSPDKVDTMVIQAISLLDELDKELNNYIMRAKEWYGWHFPELCKIVEDNAIYIDFILRVGMRDKAKDMDMTEFMSEELAQRVAEASEVSMGTEITDFDLEHVQGLCEMIKEYTAYRKDLTEYISDRMSHLAPNVTTLLGPIIGARLLSHAGSLTNLAKYPASTIQLIGAEKALFRALKQRKKTPKYGLIYHAELVSKCRTPKDKGSMSRMLANKTALGARLDALHQGDLIPSDFSVKNKDYLKNKSSQWYGGGKRDLKPQQKPVYHQLNGNRKTTFDDAEAGCQITPISTRVIKNEEGEEKKKKKKKKKDKEQEEEAPSSSKKRKQREEEEEDEKPKKKKKKE